jgi:hypothetical protein
MVNVWAKPDGTWQTFQPQIQTFTIDRLLTNVKIPTISQDYRQTFPQNPFKRLV